MALIEGCRHSLEISVPEAEVAAETDRVVAGIQKKARLPGFRPGKAPATIIRSRFESEIRQDVLENLVPKTFHSRVEQEGLQVVGKPSVSDVRFETGEGLHFKIEFEVAPEVELKDPGELAATYREPTVTDADVESRLEQLREQKADYINVDPRPIEHGDVAVVALESLSGIDPPVHTDEMQLDVGGADTLAAFNENLTGAEPGEAKEFDVTYPEDYGDDRMAGKTIRFRATVKGIRKKELPELDDAFAQDLGDFKTLEELRETLRKTVFREREFEAKQQAKNQLVDRLVEAHDFPVPEAYVERQSVAQLEQYARALQARGIDPKSAQIDWVALRDAQREAAIRDVKATLLLDKLAERESIYATQDEVDREVQRVARQRREPVAAVRMRLEKDGTLGRIASHIRTEKTLDLLFDRARKEAPSEG